MNKGEKDDEKRKDLQVCKHSGIVVGSLKMLLHKGHVKGAVSLALFTNPPTIVVCLIISVSDKDTHVSTCSPP